ncbi:Zinc finger protein RFP [Liparis tanakae]|uniref:Zinc finger protein RFP n=1 Tax=Liparis tanakae TaxID=230148 RepID=A0A4Z2FD06_9TELE|nr:Zinc finger protein RFP [Liparis tanakae]
MSAANYLPTEEQLGCCICLEVFNDPVTIPCGHNFCKMCIKQHLNSNSQRQCPTCNERVDSKCKFGVNLLISEMTLQHRRSAGEKDGKSSGQPVAKPREVSCDVPPESRPTPSVWPFLRFLFVVALLLYLTVYLVVIEHLHRMGPGQKAHQLCDAVEKAAGGVCPKHGRPLELYCKDEQMLICQSCADSSHRLHDIVPLREEYEEKIKDLQGRQAVIQQNIQEREIKIQEVQHSVSLSAEATNRQLADGVQVFTALKKTVDKNQAMVFKIISAKHQAIVNQAEGFIEGLEQEIHELTERRAEVEQLSRVENHLHFLQSFPFFNTAPLAGDLPDVRISPVSYEGDLRTTVEAAMFQLRETAVREMSEPEEGEPWRSRGNAVDVTLDPNTAHPNLIVSDDEKQVDYSDVWNEVSDDPKRFDNTVCVLGKQSFFFTRFYYDVQVSGKTPWVLGVVKQSIQRKGVVHQNPENGFWSLFHLRGGHYIQLIGRPEKLTETEEPHRVRVFVDYLEGRVSFYNVDSASLIHSFTGYSFTERLLPFFCLLHKDSVLRILTSD